MRGLKVEVIAAIRTNLVDRYDDDLAILKELIQNADDAEASCLHIGWVAQLPKANHPLLDCPAIFVLNDGEFKNEDAEAIRWMGLNSKSADTNSIGKFGYGLKSIFHLCEAFFYLASGKEKIIFGDAEISRNDILCPWGNFEKYPNKDWDNFPIEAQKDIETCLQNLITSELTSSKHWFCLWIPLRKKNHFNGWHPITNKCPGDEPGLPKLLNTVGREVELANILPLLSNLKTVKFWKKGQNSNSFELLFGLQVKADSRRRKVDSITQGKILDITGRISLELSSTNKQEIVFSGYETRLDLNVKEFQEKDGWPQTGTIDQNTGEYNEIRAKAIPHCAICFSTNLNIIKKKGVSISYAVFLPLQEKETPTEVNESKYSILLHGYFFVDAGRNHIKLAKSNSLEVSDIQINWNLKLLREGTLPLLLPALKEFVKNANLTVNEIKSLSKELKASKLFRNDEDKDAICSKSQWIYCLTSEGGRWQLVDKKVPFHELPNTEQEDLHYQVFPELKKLVAATDQGCFTLAEWPNLCVNKPSNLSIELLNKLFSKIDVTKVFSSQIRIEYLNTFLEDQNSVSILGISEALLSILKNALLTIPVSDLKKLDQFNKFLEFVPKEKYLFIKLEDEEILKELLELNLQLVIIPSVLQPKDEQQDNRKLLSVLDTKNILECLDKLIRIGKPYKTLRVVNSLVIDFIRLVDNQDELWKVCNNIKVFVGYDHLNKKENYFSYQDLLKRKSQSTLFIKTNSTTYIQELQQILVERQVVEITNNIAETLFNSAIQFCSPEACLLVIKTKPELVDKTELRANLLTNLLHNFRYNLDNETKKALRYLLHNNPNSYENNEKLIIQEVSPLGKVLAKVMQNDIWRLISKSVANQISPQDRISLDILTITSPDSNITDSIIANILIQKLTPDINNQISHLLDNEEINLLLKDDSNKELWKKLPIHTTQKGDRVQITSKTYLNLNSKINIDETICNDIVIIDKHIDVTIADIQERWIQQLDAVNIIKLCLQNDAGKHYKTILEAFDYIFYNIPEKLEKELISSLKKEKWLPTKEGKYVKPDDVAYLQGLEAEIDQITLTISSDYITPSQFKEDVWPQYKNSLINIFPQDTDAIEVLGLIMGMETRYHIGKIEIKSEDELQKFFITLKNAPFDVAVVWPILESLYKRIGLDSSILLINNWINKSISCEQICKILNYLSNCEEVIKNTSSIYLEIFNIYLKELFINTTFNISYLSKISLLNKNEKWCSPNRLCIDYVSIASEYLLDKTQESIVKEHGKYKNSSSNNHTYQNHEIYSTDSKMGAINKEEYNQHFDKSIELLKEYFNSWEQRVEQKIIGGFLCFLSNHPKMEKLAATYLDKLSIDQRLERLTWNAPKRRLPLKGLASSEFDFPEYQNVHEAREKNRFIIEIIDANKIEVTSITGNTFEAEIEKDIVQLFVGNLERIKKTPDYYIYRLKLRKLLNTQLDIIKNKATNALSDILLKSIQEIFSTVYGQKSNNLDEIWKEFEKSEQLDIQVAQNLLLDSAFLYLTQLGMGQLEHLKSIYQRWQANRYRIEEITSVQSSQSNNSLKKAYDEKTQIRSELKDLITKNSLVQSNLLSAIKGKLVNSQYQMDSIPFELFQNADDAVVELEKIVYQSDNKSVPSFVVVVSETEISFLHWGRRVNQSSRFGSDLNCQDLGFDRDLEKMLILSSSDKSLTDNISVTGKFGLGFKSVFLATDSPKVLSGRLNFEVIGGLYPNILSEEKLKELKEELKEHSSSSHPFADGTIIRLPASPENINKLLKRFKELISVLLVFAKKIRNCQMYINNKPDKNYLWLEQPLINRSQVSIGNLQFGEKFIKALILRTNNCALLLAVGTDGIYKLPQEIPTIWVTTPTRETISFGFAINGPFAIDVGRAQLADVAANRDIAYKLGIQLGEAFCQIYEATQENWQAFSRNIGLAPNTTEYMFWLSLWELFTDCFKADKATEDKATKILSLILWGSRDCGMAKLLYKYPVLPNGLFGNYKKLIRLNEIHCTINGTLDEKDVFLATSEWDSFCEIISTEKTISKSHIYDVVSKIISVASSAGAKEKLDSLSEIFHKLTNSRPIDLHTILEKEFLKDLKIDPRRANKFGKLITKKFLDKTGEEPEDEYKRIQNTIKVANFRSVRDYKPVQDLLIKDQYFGENKDEFLRASFAPEEYLLNAEYKDDALLFFKACRQKLNAPPERLCEWGKRAEKKDSQIAFLRYLLEGDLWSQVIDLLKYNLSDWLRELPNWYSQKTYAPISAADFATILLRLGLIEPPPDLIKSYISIPANFAKNTLEKIYSWWKINHKEYLAKYNKSIYPDNHFPHFINNEFNPNNYDERLDWVNFFFLGIMHTIGRTKPEAHRGFLLEHKKLIEQFAEHSISFQTPFNSIRNYIDSCPQDIERYPWIKQFVGFYIISHWLDDYIQSFLDIDKSKSLALDIVLCPKINPAYQGTSIGDCPPINRVLGIGACFVVRELIRNKVITNQSAYKYCYVPSYKVKYLLRQLGCNDLENQNEPSWSSSQYIYQFIKNQLQENFTFDLCFDIPLFYFAQDYELQKELLGTCLLSDYKDLGEGY